MKCSHFGKCGSCDNYNLDYNKALDEKKKRLLSLLEPFYQGDIEVFSSKKSHHRSRAEFRIWHQNNKAYYAMSNLEKNGIEILQECPKVLTPIANIWDDLLKAINKSSILKEKLFSIEFLATTQNEILVTLIYHKKLNNEWELDARALETKFGIFIIGRSKKQKIVLSKEYVKEKLTIFDKEFIYHYYENSFTQPNPYMNQKMIEWACNCVKEENNKDFIELYCGLGNFTLPLSFYFRKVLATEISKTSIKAAKENCVLNNINNIEFVRLSASETAQALFQKRKFNRLKEINLEEYQFETVLVDPPRAGLDSDSLELVKNFDKIIYISCNPITLARNLEQLSKTHKIKKAALFDQFPYTHHIESGVYLERK